MQVSQSLRAWAGKLKKETLALYYAAGDPRTPWYAKAIAGLVVAYALSPIDLIPDFIPVLGYLDDVLLLPLGIWLALRLVPEAVLREARGRAEQMNERPISRLAAAFIIAVWIFITLAVGLWLYRWFAER